jgi:hypothetical protein
VDALVFASFFPTSQSIDVGRYYLNIFRQNYSDCDIYIGIKPSPVITEWIAVLESRHDLRISYSVADESLVIDSDASAFQAALRVMAHSGKEYETVFFGHSKGSTNQRDRILKMLERDYWRKRGVISSLFQAYPQHGIYSAAATIACPPVYSNRAIIHNYCNFRYKNLHNVAPLFTFYAIRGELVAGFLAECDLSFFDEKLYNRYFFEDIFPHIVSANGYLPMFRHLETIYIRNKVNYRILENDLRAYLAANSIQMDGGIVGYRESEGAIFKDYLINCMKLLGMAKLIAPLSALKSCLNRIVPK